MKISDYGLVKTSRENGAQFLSTEGSFVEDNEVLALCLPFGDPGPDMLKFKVHKKHYILTFLQHSTEDTGLALLANFSISDNRIINPITLAYSLKKLINEENFSSITGTLEISGESNPNTHIKLDKLETVIAAILMGKKIFLLGSQDEFDAFLAVMFKVFPPEAYSLLEFSSPTNSLSENTIISGIPPTDSNMNLLDQIGSEDGTIVFFDEHTCYGNYSSPMSKEIAKLIQKKNYEKTRELISKLFSTAKLSDEIISNPSSLAKENSISKADALLVMNIRAKLFNKQPPTNIFEKLIA